MGVWTTQQQPVLRRDLRRGSIASRRGSRAASSRAARRTSIASGGIQPALESAGIARLEIVAARQDGEARARTQRAIDDDVGQAATRVARDHDVIRCQAATRLEAPFEEGHAFRQPRPDGDQCLARAQRTAVASCRWRPRRTMSRREAASLARAGRGRPRVDDATAAKQPAGPARDFPRLVELLARQATGRAHSARDPIEHGLPGKPRQVSLREPAA